MPTPAYISITRDDGAVLTEEAFTAKSVGNVYQEGHENEAMVQAFSHEVHIPRDPQSGQPTGQAVHNAVCITKVFDKSSPLLMNALADGQRLKEVQIKWYRTSMGGQQEHYYTTTLEDAVIVRIKDHMPNCQDPATAHFTHLQDVHFSYRKIIWNHVTASTEGSADWRAPVAAAG